MRTVALLGILVSAFVSQAGFADDCRDGHCDPHKDKCKEGRCELPKKEKCFNIVCTFKKHDHDLALFTESETAVSPDPTAESLLHSLKT
jgi:hypothetical protein